MNRKILIGCYEIPGHGGASTATYKLFELMQNDGLEVYYLNIIEEEDADYFRYVYGENFGNPKSLRNVFNCVLKGNLFDSHPELAELINNLAPDISVGVGFIAALLMKKAVPRKDLIFIASGCNQAGHYIESKVAKDSVSLLSFLRHPKGLPAILNEREREAVDLSDFIITHSDMIKEFLNYFYPFHTGRISLDIIWFADWIYKDAESYQHLQRPFFERDIDVLFVASIWKRIEKNLGMLKEIVRRGKDLKIHIVGELENKIPNSICHGLLAKREELFTLLGRTKSVVCPSIIDAAPGILFEASALGCNIITSKNCGNWQICNKELFVDPFKAGNFFKKITLSLTKKYEDNMDFFLKTNSYENLKNIILAF